MFKKIRRRTREDKGDSVIVLGLMLIMSLLLVGGILLDISKAYQLKSSYIDSARKATQAAIVEQTTEGYLRPEAAGRAVHVYEHIARRAVINSDGYFSKCVNYGDDDVEYRVTFMNEDGGELVVGPVRRAELPYVPKIEGVDKVAIETITNMMEGWNHDVIRNGKYTSIKLEVTEGTENAILPGAFSITQADSDKAEGMKCQKINVRAKANIFIGDKDGLYN